MHKLTKLTLLLSLVLLPLAGCATAEAEADAAPAAALENDDDRALYALGVALARNIAQFDFEEAELAKIRAGLTDGAGGTDLEVDLMAVGPQIDGFLRGRMEMLVERDKTRGTEALAAAEAESGAVKLESGMVYHELAAGDGAQPGETDRVKLNYKGSLPGGKIFDQTTDEPAEFDVGIVVPCFSEGVRSMKVGGKAKLVCPPELAYGQQGSPPFIRPGATLIFEVELLEIVTGESTE